MTGGGGGYFHAGDIVRLNGKLMEVTAETTARYVFVVRARWWRRAWSYVRRAAR